MTTCPTLRRTWRENRRGLIGWGIAINLLVWVEMAVYPTIHKLKDFQKLVDNYPKQLKAFFDIQNGASISTAKGFLGTELFSFMVPLLAILYCIFLGVRAIASEENDGLLDLYLSAPIKRSRYVTEKTLAVLFLLAALMGSIFVSLLIGNQVVSMHLGLSSMFAPIVTTFVMAALCGILALSVSIAIGNRGFGIAIATGLAILGYLTDSLAKLAHTLRFLEKISIFYFLSPSGALRSGTEGVAVSITVIVTVLIATAGGTLFKNRDLHV